MTDIHDQVRDFYRKAAEAGPNRRDCTSPDDRWGAVRYEDDSLAEVPAEAAGLSMGCGNPHAMAELVEGETVLDLGSGAGMDVILSAKRVAPTGKAYGVDFLDEMLKIASDNASSAGVKNVEFLAGTIEDVPLPDGTVDVVISNCVINLAPDKSLVFAEIARVLKPGGRISISDVVAVDDAPAPDLTDADAWSACGSGALRRSDYIKMLKIAGFDNVNIEFTHEVGQGLHAAIVRGTSAAA